MNYRWAILSLILFTGCSRQDTEILARVGKKISEHAQASTSTIRDKWSFALPMSPTLADQVRQRLASDKLLHSTPFDIQLRGAEIGIKGEVASDELKRRALEIVENTHGVEKVVDGVKAGVD